MGNPEKSVGFTANTTALEVPPPGLGCITCIKSSPPVVRSAAVRVVETCVVPELTVLRARPLIKRTAFGAKPVPVTERTVAVAVDVVAVVPAWIEVGFTEIRFGTGLLTIN